MCQAQERGYPSYLIVPLLKMVFDDYLTKIDEMIAKLLKETHATSPAAPAASGAAAPAAPITRTAPPVPTATSPSSSHPY